MMIFRPFVRFFLKEHLLYILKLNVLRERILTQQQAPANCAHVDFTNHFPDKSVACPAHLVKQPKHREHRIYRNAKAMTLCFILSLDFQKKALWNH